MAKTATMMIVGTGTPAALAPASAANPSGRSQIGRPSVKRNAAPRQMVISASVAMNGVMLTLVMSTPAAAPEKAPIPSPARRAAGRATASGTCQCSRAVVMTPVKATTDPTERSIPAVRITKVIPAAMMAMIDVWRETLRMFSGVKK